MATEKQSQESQAFGSAAGLGAYNNPAQPATVQPASDLTLTTPSGAQVKGDALANAFGVGAFNKK